MRIAVLASVATRPVFWHFVVWLKVIWYLLAVTSVFVFAYGLIRPAVKYNHGHGGQMPHTHQLPPLLWPDRAVRSLDIANDNMR